MFAQDDLCLLRMDPVKSRIEWGGDWNTKYVKSTRLNNKKENTLVMRFYEIDLFSVLILFFLLLLFQIKFKL